MRRALDLQPQLYLFLPSSCRSFRFRPPCYGRIPSARTSLFGSEFGSSVSSALRAAHFAKRHRVRIFFAHPVLYAHNHLKNQE